MWSQPNIVALNAEAKASVRKLRKAQKYPRKHECEFDPVFHHGEVEEGHRADHAIEWYDIFSDDPKDLIYICDNAYKYGAWREGYFDCEECERLFITNYTWEPYRTYIDDREVCIPCALKLYMADEDNWIDPKLVGDMIGITRGAPLLDYDNPDEEGRPALNVSVPKHVIAVDMPTPGLEFIGNFEFDKYSGSQISGNHQGVFEKAIEEGYDKVLVVRDAEYQFAVSIGVYGRKRAA